MEYLDEKVEMHDILNPNIWTNDNHLRPEVKDKLEEIVNEFLIELEENEIPIHILDVHLVGSNASYNYTDKSDLDVHIIANLEDVTCDPYVLNLLYGYFKSYFNDKYDISIHGVDVELYIEDVNTSSISNGIYSLFDDEWVKFPEKIEVPDVDISKDIIPYKNMYDSAMDSKDGMEAIMLVDDLYLLRRNSLSTDGEYGIGNLIFKEFRNNGWLDKLKDLSNEYKSETLTLEQLNESLNDFMSMEHLMSEAKERGVRPRDLFDSYDYLVDAQKFFNYMIKGTELSYQTGPKTRILNNRPYNEFYKTLLGYLDSLGTNKPYSKIEPALVKELPNGSLQPLDGRHRSQFCMMLGIPLPVRVQQQGANKDYESLNGSLNKVSSKGVKNSKLGSTIKSRPLQPKVINEIMNNGSVENDWDLWQGGGYDYKYLAPQTQEFISNHLQYTTLSLSRIETSTYSTRNNDLKVGEIINIGLPKSFSRTINGTINILRFDDWDPEDTYILRTVGKVQYFDGRNIKDDSDAIYAYQEEVLCGGIFKVVGTKSLDIDDNIYNVYLIVQVSTPKWIYTSITEDLDLKNIQDYIKDNFSFSLTPPEGQTYIMPDGKFLELGYDGAHIGVDDMLYQDNLIDYDPYEYGHELILVDKFNAVRCSDGEAINANPYIQLPPKKVTQDQLDSIMDWLDKLKESSVYIEGVEYNLDEVTVDYVIKRILRYYSSGVMYEDYLDDENKFWNYNTRPIEGDNIFDPYVGESSYARDMIKLAGSRKVDKEGHYAGYVEMSPREYFDACAKGFGIPAKDQINTVSNDKGVIQTLNTILDKYKVRFPVAYLDYSFNNFSQEGRHRMYVAGQRVGWDKKFPVLVIHTTEEGNKAKHEERITRYIIKALSKTEQYTYSNFDEIKEQFTYDIEDLLSNPKVEFKETADTYIFIVNGVEYEEEKDSFNFYNGEEDETNINDIDVEDFLDLDDLSDDDIFNM